MSPFFSLSEGSVAAKSIETAKTRGLVVVTGNVHLFCLVLVVLLLASSDRFQCDGYSDAVDDGGGEDGVGGNKFATFTELVLRYIVDGAPDEVNIRYST